MAHKVLVGGTSYDITKGRTLIGGTGYDITKGRTLVGGTGYDISFLTATFDEIMADATIASINGRSSSSSASLNASFRLEQTEIFYVFQFYNGFLTISKVLAEYNGEDTAPTVTKTDLAYTDTSQYSPFVEGTVTVNPRANAYVSTNGTSSTSVYGAVIALLQFPSYPISLVDSVLSSVTLTTVAGRNRSSTGSVSGTYSASARWFAAFTNISAKFMAYSSPLGTVIMSNNTTNPSGLCAVSATVWALSANGTSAASLYGGSIVEVTE